jgi:DNA mismatch repair ATPase MutL
LKRAAEQTWAEGGFVLQRLLFPVVREASVEEAACAERQADAARRYGFDLRRAGERALAVHAVPRLFAAAAPDSLAEALHDQLARIATGHADEIAVSLIQTMVERTAGAQPRADPSLIERLENDNELLEATAVERLRFDRLEP